MKLLESNIPEFFDPKERAEYSSFLTKLPGPYFILERGGSIVGAGGIARGRDDLRRIDLCWGMIAKPHHRQGAGKALLVGRLAEALAYEPSLFQVRLKTSQVVQGFYEKMGFNVLATAQNALGPGLDLVVMEAGRYTVEKIASGG